MKLPPNENLHSEVQLRFLLSEIPSRRSGYGQSNHKVLNLKEGTVTATFKNVPKGTWVVGMHAFNRTSEDGKKVFSPWSNLKKATVK